MAATPFCKEEDSIMVPEVRTTLGSVTSWIGILCNVLVIGKIVVGLLSGVWQWLPMQ